jgi:hypothetical protein
MGNDEQSPSDGHMIRLATAFILKARASSHCAWFTRGARTGRDEMEYARIASQARADFYHGAEHRALA